MKSRLLNFLDQIKSSFWFVPSLMVLISMFLAWFSLYLDQNEGYHEFIRKLSWVWTGGAEGAREMLSTIAGSMMTVTGVTFSITIVTLTLASSQFGPRVLRNFVRDRGNQIVLGTFISTFTFSMIVLGQVRGQEDNTFVPYLSVTVAFGLALASLYVLIYFIHHVSDSIQAENLVAKIGEELNDIMDRLFPEKIGHQKPTTGTEIQVERIKKELKGQEISIRSNKSGYLQAVDAEGLLKLASQKGLLVQLHYRPGTFIAKGARVAEVWPLDVFPGDLEGAINKVLIVGRHRTPVQDAEYPVHQLVEVALRALSPSMNDPYTAINCIDRLGDALGRLASRQFPSKYRFDESDQLRIIAETTSFKRVADIAFNQIREMDTTNVEVSLRMLRTIAVVSEMVTRQEDKEALKIHADLVKKKGLQLAYSYSDKDEMEQAYRETVQQLTGPETHPPSNIGRGSTR